MKEFMSLREFLLIKESYTEPKRSALRLTAEPEEFVRRYDIAKESWEKYGIEGPPTFSKVEMLEAGHGGGVGAIRILEGVYENDSRFFEVSRIENRHGKQEKRISLVCRETWFVSMKGI